MYAIIGATGNIGSKTADLLLARGERVRVIGRDAAKLQRFVAKGAEAMVGDLKDEAFLTRALTDVSALFAMIPPAYTEVDFRAYQREVGENIVTAIKRAGIRHVVNLSSQGAELAAGTGPIVGLHDQEERLNRLDGVNVLHLRPTYFMENLLVNIPLIRERGITGSAVEGNLRFAMIATRDIAAHLAERLVKRNFGGKLVQDLLGERDLSLAEATTIIGRKIGKPELTYVQFPYGDAEAAMINMGLTPDMSRLYIEMSKALNNGLFAVNRPRTAGNTTPTSMEEFAVTFAEIYGASTERHAA